MGELFSLGIIEKTLHKMAQICDKHQISVIV